MNAIAEKTITPIKPYTMGSAMVALKNGASDSVLLNYLRFLVNQFPFTNLQFLHVLQKGSLDFQNLDKEAKALLNTFNIKGEVVESLKEKVENIITVQDKDRLNYLVKEGYPLEELIYRSKLNAADLVIIGQSTVQVHHNILARNFLRKVKTNALIVPDKTSPTLSRILVPLDFSRYSLIALRTAVALNKTLENPVPIVALHVFELPNLTFYNVEKTKKELKTIIQKDRAMAMDHFLDRQIPNAKDRQSIQTEIVEKEFFDIGYQVFEHAKSSKADLIIMGAKGHSKAELLMIGSVTERVLGLTKKIPMLIVK